MIRPNVLSTRRRPTSTSDGNASLSPVMGSPSFTTSQTKPPSYRAELDGLRAVAIVVVIINHLRHEWLPSGYLGVDIFFVLSGFVITASLAHRRSGSLREFLLGFYTRRIKRLLPVLVLSVAITGVAISLFDHDPAISLCTGIAALSGMSNLYLLGRATDYFAQEVDLNAFTQTWSLGVEEQFYVLYPLLIWTSGFAQQTRRGARHLFWLVLTLSGVSLVAFIYLERTYQPAAYFLMPTRLWELGAGCLIFLLLQGGRASSSILSKISPLGVMVALVASLCLPLRLSTLATISAVALTTLLIASLRAGTIGYRLLTLPPVVYIGQISYSLYLWHWSVLVLSRWTVGIRWWSVPILLALMLTLAEASHRFLEKPLRSATWSPSKWKTIAYGIGASVAAAGSILLLAGPLRGHLYLGSIGAQDSAILEEHANSVKEATKLRRDCNMTPQYLGGSDYRSQPKINAEFLRNCLVGAPSTGRKKMVVVGDSFASASARHLAVIAEQIGYEFRLLFGYGCPYPLAYSTIKSRSKERCSQVPIDLLQSELRSALSQGDLLVVRLYLPKSDYLRYGGNFPPVDAYDESLARLGTMVQERHARLLLIGANPTLTPHLVATIEPQWFNSFRTPTSLLPTINPATEYFHVNDDHLVARFADSDYVSFFSLKPYLCDAKNVCQVRRDGKPLYEDTQHLTPYAHDLFHKDLLQQVTCLVTPNGVSGSSRYCQQGGSGAAHR